MLRNFVGRCWRLPAWLHNRPVSESDLVPFADRLLDELCERFPIGYRPVLVWKRLRVSAGIAKYRERTIVLSRTILTDRERLDTTLKHEYAHLLAVARHGRKAAGHGPHWQAAMSDLGLEPAVRHQYEVVRNAKRQEVGYRCRRCGALITRGRRLNGRRRYVHSLCGGPLKLEFVRQAQELPENPVRP
jgi:predicted SprT family Zn-dependent metalloprotease